MLALMHLRTDEKRRNMFIESTEAVHEQLQYLVKEAQGKLRQILSKATDKMTRDYHSTIIAPQIQKLSAEQRNFKAQVDAVLQRTQADLRLDELLKLGRGRHTRDGLPPRV